MSRRPSKSGLRCLQPVDWPEPDRQRWEVANQDGDILDGRGPAAHWRDKTRRQVRKCFGQFVDWCLQQGHSGDIATGITPEQVVAYVAHLEVHGLAPVTVRNRIRDLREALRVMCPDKDWGWLKHMVCRLEFRTQHNPKRNTPILHPRELLMTALAHIDTAERNEVLSQRDKARRVRDGLIVALLAARPIRANNFSSARIGQHLQRNGSGYTLAFTAEETKHKRPLNEPVPEVLVPYLVRYLEQHRQHLMSFDTDRLWIGDRPFGKPLAYTGLYHLVRRVTFTLTGTAISPHAFRHSAATAIAVDVPEQVGIASALLSHFDAKITERHYNRASSITAARTLQKAVLARRHDHTEGTSS